MLQWWRAHLDCLEVEVVALELLQHVGAVDALGPHVLVAHQLRGPKDEGQKVVVVQAPHAVRPRRLQPVLRLQLAHHRQVLRHTKGSPTGATSNKNGGATRSGLTCRRHFKLTRLVQWSQGQSIDCSEVHM